MARCALAIAAVAGCADPPAPIAREVRGGPFSCEGDACAQAFPAYPDDGEWECLDSLGVVLCRGGIPPAGARSGPRDPGFVCGAPLPGDPHGRRVCVDGAPDVPWAGAAEWTCRFDRDGEREMRRCDRVEARPWLEAPCGVGCPAGLECRDGRCALGADPTPDCWLDEDCEGGGRCALGRCSSH